MNATIANPDAMAAFSARIGSPSRLHLDLFSGIGGFALAARRSGWQTIALSEIEPYACKILAKNFPGIPNLGDIRALRGIPCDLITGGFPCQPYSLAGKRGGASDDRALWPEMLRVIVESKPRWVLGENVPGIISMELDRVLTDLESIGYSVWPIVIPAVGCDARHARSRVWILAHCESIGRGEGRAGRPDPSGARKREQTLQALADTAGNQRESHQVVGQHRRRANAITQRGGENVADSKRERNADDRPGQTHCATGTVQGDGAERERLRSDAGQQDDHAWAEWQPEPNVGRVADGIPNRVDRLKGLGNAIVPQVAEVLMREMAWMENS